MLKALGQENSRGSSNCVVKIFFVLWEAVWKAYVMSSVMCIRSFLECLVYENKRLTKTTFFRNISYDMQFPGYAKGFP